MCNDATVILLSVKMQAVTSITLQGGVTVFPVSSKIAGSKANLYANIKGVEGRCYIPPNTCLRVLVIAPHVASPTTSASGGVHGAGILLRPEPTSACEPLEADKSQPAKPTPRPVL